MDNNELDLSVDEQTGPGHTSSPRRVIPVLTIGLLILLCAGIVIAVLLTRPGTAAPQSQEHALTEEQLKEYALKLEDRGLFSMAGNAWKDYIGALDSGPGAEEVYRMADCFFKAGEYTKALDGFYRAEMLDSDKKIDISTRVQRCLEGLGKYTALQQELEQRAAADQGQESTEEVLAAIGPTTITKKQLKLALEQQVERQLRGMGAGPDTEHYKEQKQKIIQQYLNRPGMLEQMLQTRIETELLYKAAAENGFKQTPEEGMFIENLRKQMIGDRYLTSQAREKITITESDLRTFYRANIDDYTVQPGVKMTYIVKPTKDDLLTLLEDIDGSPEKFDAIAAKRSNGDPGQWVTEGRLPDELDGFKNMPELVSDTYATGDMAGPFKVHNGYAVIRILDRREGSTPTFEEVKQEISRDFYGQKYNEIYSRIITRLKDRFQVRIYEDKLQRTESTTR